jgi:hypothetical protein
MLLPHVPFVVSGLQECRFDNKSRVVTCECLDPTDPALLNFADRMGESDPLGRLRPSLLLNGADRIGEGAFCLL